MIRTAKPSRKEQILDVAFTVIARHGFRKTSIEDVARAAYISRQGMYLYFKNKEDLFRQCIHMKLDRALASSSKALLSENAPLEEKLLDAFQEWFGKHAGLFHMETSDIIEQSRAVMGDTIDRYRRLFRKRLVETIRKSSSKKINPELVNEVVQMLFACGFGWKLELTNPGEFRKRMKAAISICMRNL